MIRHTKNNSEEVNNLRYLEYLTSKRFETTRTETIEALRIIEKYKLSEIRKIEKVNEEDILILIKIKTFKKSVKKLF